MSGCGRRIQTFAFLIQGQFENIVAADCSESEQDRESSLFYRLRRHSKNRKQTGVFRLQTMRRSGIFPPIRDSSTAYCFKPKQAVLVCKTACFTAPNRPF